jgi:hypothetical protein
MNAKFSTGGRVMNTKDRRRMQRSPTADKNNLTPGSGQHSLPATHHLAADENMDDDTGLSNRANRQSADVIDEGSRQELQSNVGRRSDGTPD